MADGSVGVVGAEGMSVAPFIMLFSAGAGTVSFGIEAFGVVIVLPGIVGWLVATPAMAALDLPLIHISEPTRPY